ncbi:Hypothetical predicted protein, partial [Pelobates cultripes]
MAAELRHALDWIQSQSRYSDLALESFLSQPYSLLSDDILSNPLLAVTIKAWKMARASMGQARYAPYTYPCSGTLSSRTDPAHSHSQCGQ